MATITPKLTVGPSPPVGPTVGDLWWNNVNGFLFIWYDDTNSAQWVVCNPGVGGQIGPPGPPAFNGPFVDVPITAGGQVTFDCGVGTAFDVTVTANIVLQTINNVLPAQISTFLVQFTGNGTSYTHSWPGWTWLSGVPVLSSALGKRDLVTVFTPDGLSFFATMYAQYF